MRYTEHSNRGMQPRMIVAVALIIALLAASAFAVVQGNLLRTKIEESAGTEFANQVQDVHVSAGNDDFSFTVDEILCEGDRMYLSYSVSVPDDGNTYLYALYRPKLNGEALSCAYAYFYDEAGMPLIHAIGGQFDSKRSEVIRDLMVELDPQADAANMLDIQAVFFKTDRTVQYAGEWEQYSAMMETFVASEDENGSELTADLLPDTDILYYYGEEADAEWATIYLEFHPDYWKNWWAAKQGKIYEAVLTPEELAATGIAELVDSVELSVPLDLSGNAQPEYNDVAQRIFEMDGFTLEITDFRMNHLCVSYNAEIRADAEIPDEYAGTEAYSQFYALLRPDGTELNNGQGSSIGSGYVWNNPDGSRVYRIEQEIRAVIPVEEIDSLLLAPQLFADDGGFIGYDLEKAIRIEPVFTPNKPEPTHWPIMDDPAVSDDISN